MRFPGNLELWLRRVDVRLRLIVAFTLVVAIVTGLMGFYATAVMEDKTTAAVREKLKDDSALGQELINVYYPGDWEIRDGFLYKGGALMEENYFAVDRIGKLTGDSVTIFRDDVRVATNITTGDERLVGTTAPARARIQVLQKGKNYSGQDDVMGTTHQALYQPIHDRDGKVIGIWYMGVPRTDYDLMVDKFRINMLVCSALGILLGFIAACLIAYTVYRPLQRIKGAVQLASQGDLRQNIPAQPDDEAGQLARTVNTMLERISGLIRKSSGIIDNVNEASTQLLGRSQLSAGNMEQMTARAGEMKKRATFQAELTGRSQKAIEDMSAAIQQLAESSREASDSAFSATARAREGARQVNQAISQMTTLGRTVNSSARVVEGLGMRSREIAKKATLINNIANQTNRLALDAAVEAAQSGDQGQGFAMVAEQVRQLAEESALAAKRIAALVEEVQSDAQRAATALQSGTRQAKNGAEAVATTGEAFSQVIQAISAVNLQTREMILVSEKMAASAEQAFASIKQTTASAEENSHSALEIARLAGEQMDGIQDMNDALDSLNGIVRDLQETITYFRTDGGNQGSLGWK